MHVRSLTRSNPVHITVPRCYPSTTSNSANRSHTKGHQNHTVQQRCEQATLPPFQPPGTFKSLLRRLLAQDHGCDGSSAAHTLSTPPWRSLLPCMVTRPSAATRLKPTDACQAPLLTVVLGMQWMCQRSSALPRTDTGVDEFRVQCTLCACNQMLPWQAHNHKTNKQYIIQAKAQKGSRCLGCSQPTQLTHNT